MVLEKVSFSPSESVSYNPDSTKQNVNLVISNPGAELVVFKLKSTRPGVYKMRPVYGMVKPGDATTVKLIFKGIKPGQLIQQMLKDHYTIIYTVAPGSTTNIQKIWTSHKFHAKMVGNEMRKYQLRILFKGYNDVEQSHDPSGLGDSETRRRTKIVKGEGLVDQEATGRSPTIIAPAQQDRPAILMMYRDVAPMSESESEGEDSDDEKPPVSGLPPQSQQTKSTTPAQSQKLPVVSQQTKSGVPKTAVSSKPTTSVSKAPTVPEMPTAPMANLNLGNKALPPKK